MAKQKISIVRGTTNTFAVAVVDEAGDAYTLGSGEVLRFGVKKRPEDAEYIFMKESTAPNTDGEYEFNIEVDDTATLPFGDYYYDVGLQSDTDYYNVIPASSFKIAFNVTEWEE